MVIYDWTTGLTGKTNQQVVTSLQTWGKWQRRFHFQQ